ncbi:RNA polymerase beta subunit [Pseudomonas phage D6]|nr:RNA polymerase beta subunit [Pseudomonas phage D6]
MRLQIEQFRKQYTVFEQGKLQQPKLHLLNKFHLPHRSVVHFSDPNSAVRGPSQSDPMFNKATGKVYIEHVLNLTTLEGNPRKSALTGNKLQAEFRQHHAFFKPLTKDEALSINPLNIMVFNYNLLDPQWIYQPNFKAQYLRWSNNQRTFWQNVAASHRRFGWEQFVEIHLPEQMPDLASFKRMADNQNQTMLDIFTTPQQFSIWDLYRWLGPFREQSMMSVVQPDMYSKIWFLIRARDRFVVLNMGALDEWRDGTKDAQVSVESFLKDFGRDAFSIAQENICAGEEFAHNHITQVMQEYGLTNQVALESFITTFGMEAFFPPAVMQRRVLSLLTALTEYSHQAETLSNVIDHSKLEDVVDEEPEKKDDEEEDEDQYNDSEPENADDSVNGVQSEDSLDLPSFSIPSLDFSEDGATYNPPDAELFTTKLQIESDPELANRPRELKVETQRVDAIPPEVAEAVPLVAGVAAPAYDLYKLGIIAPRTFEQALQDAQSYKTIKDPFGSGVSMEEAMEYKQEDYTLPPDTQLADSDTILDKSMLGSKLKAMQRKYQTTLRNKDLIQAVMSVQKQGTAVTNYEVEEVRNAMNHYEIHKVTLKPIRGKPGTVYFRLPVVDRDGRYMSNGVTYRMRMQRADLPIRKVKPDTVAMTSYYNKTFVMRSHLAAHNYDAWITRQIRERALDPEDDRITGVLYAELDQSAYALPRVYTQLGSAFRGFSSGPLFLYFKFDDHVEYFQTKYKIDAKDHETNRLTLVGVHGKKPVLLDKGGQFYVKDKDNLEPLGSIVELLGLDQSKAPLEAAFMNVGSKELPLAFVLGYKYGLQATLKRLNAKFTRHHRGERIPVSADNYVLAFQDEVLVFDRSDYRTQLVLGGMRKYAKLMPNFSIYDFEKPDVYQRLLLETGMTARFTKEIDALFTAWVDPITEGLLKQMGEPTTFDGLLYRAVDMLLIDWSPSEVDGAYMRYRGYERMAGAVYNELNKAVKRFNGATGSAAVQVQMDPAVVWKKIAQDPTIMVVEDSNPLANIREQESMTYRGDGGRSTTSMVARTRVYGQADVGVVSESTVDSGDVGVIAYLTPDANFDSMRGTTRPFDPTTDGPARQLSTCALLGVATTNDDTKRINFISIQQQQGIYADGYEPTPLRTGYEQIVAQRTSSIFASAAEDDGKVIAVDEYGITVEYANGETTSYQMGKIHGSAAGTNYPHSIISDLKVGDTFKRGQTLAYNEKYFTPDRMTPGQVIWKAGINTVVAFSDNLDTLEDGSVISERCAIKMNTQTSKIKSVGVKFEQNIENMVKVGDHVDLDSILCTIKDADSGGGSVFDEVSRETLAKLSNYSPRAKVVGVVSKIEVFYHGDRDEMSDSLRKLAYESDKIREAEAKSRGQQFFSGEVDHEYRIRGNGLEPQSLIINIYIDHDIPCGVGDKGVVANQMKTVFSRVMRGVNQTKSGLDIDLIFGNTSVEERMVLSPKLIGTTTILLAELSKHLVGVYRGTANAKSK